MRTEARFPEIPEKAGHYESFYLKLVQPGGGRAAWIRHTVHKRPGEEATCALWFVLFDSSAAGPRATKRQFGADELERGAGHLHPDRRRRRSPTAAPSAGSRPDALEAKWDLAFADSHEPFHHLPRDFLYRSKLPKTKFLSPYPDAVFNGELEVGGERIDVTDWRGHDRPQLGRRARRALGLDPGLGLRGPLAGGLLRHGGRPDQGRGTDDALGRQRDADARRQAAPPRRLRARPQHRGGGVPTGARFELKGKGVKRHRQRQRRAPRTSSPGSTPIRSAPSTTRSTARSPTWSSTSSSTAAPPSASPSRARPHTSSARATPTTASRLQPYPDG